MKVEIKSLRSKSDFPEDYDQLVSGVESYYPFNVTHAEKDKMIIYSNSSIANLNISDILSGKEKISICVAIDSSLFTNESTKKVAVRSILKRIKSIKGFELFENRLYTLPSGVINTLYKGDATSFLAKENGGAKEESETTVIEAFKEICFNAFKENASDIHFIADEDDDTCLIQYRINGELEYADSPAYSNGLAMCRAAYSSKADASSRSDTAFNEKLRQDARIVLRFGEDKVAFRYASTPTSTGFLVVLRLLPVGVKGRVMTLEELGYLPSQARIIESMMRKPIGAIIVAGVTGSGKSTTLKVLLEKKACEDSTKRVITIEQPVEYKIQGAIQIPVTACKPNENPFEGTIKSGMRLDPDTIMAGEVRDGVTATLLASATESGHSVLTTIHAGSALEIISRLTGQSMKLPSDTVASMSFIAGLIYQKLVPVLCNECRIALPVDEFKNSEDHYKRGLIQRLEMVVDDLDSLFIRNHDGCDCCRKGVTGVEVCAEVILPDLKLRNYWRTGEDLSAYEHWRSTADPNNKTNGQGRTALEVAIYKMTLGRLCPIGIEKSFGDINEDAVLEDGVRTYSEVQ